MSSKNKTDEKIKDYLERSLSKSLLNDSFLGIEKRVEAFLHKGDKRTLSELSATEYKLIKDSLLGELTGDPSKKGRSALRSRAVFEEIRAIEGLEEDISESLQRKIPEIDIEDLSVLPLPYLLANLDFAQDKSLSTDMKVLLSMEAYKGFLTENPGRKLHEGAIHVDTLTELIERSRVMQEDLQDTTEILSILKEPLQELMEDIHSFTVDTYSSMLARLLESATVAPLLSISSFGRLLRFSSEFLASHIGYDQYHMKFINLHFFGSGLYSVFVGEEREPYFDDEGSFIEPEISKGIKED